MTSYVGGRGEGKVMQLIGEVMKSSNSRSSSIMTTVTWPGKTTSAEMEVEVCEDTARVRSNDSIPSPDLSLTS